MCVCDEHVTCLPLHVMTHRKLPCYPFEGVVWGLGFEGLGLGVGGVGYIYCNPHSHVRCIDGHVATSVRGLLVMPLGLLVEGTEAN